MTEERKKEIAVEAAAYAVLNFKDRVLRSVAAQGFNNGALWADANPPTSKLEQKLTGEERDRIKTLKEHGSWHEDNTDIDWLIELVERLK